MLSGIEFQRRIEEGKKEWRWESFFDCGVKKLNGRRGKEEGIRSSLFTVIRLVKIVYIMVTFTLALRS